jgi:hypothetical protein
MKMTMNEIVKRMFYVSQQPKVNQSDLRARVQDAGFWKFAGNVVKLAEKTTL